MSETKELLRKFFGQMKIRDTATVSPEDTEDCLFLVSYATNTGYFRMSNEDSFFVDGKCTHRFGESEQDCYAEHTEGTHVFGLFDGMGGEDHGEIAAELTAKALGGAFKKLKAAQPSELDELINEVCRNANKAVCDMIKERGAKAGGATFTAVCVCGETAYAYWLGDSRIYLYDGSVLTQLTSDHTVAAARLAAGETVTSRDHHALTHFIGMDRLGGGTSAFACEPKTFGSGCTLLMCSDGLTDMLTDREIAEVLSERLADPASELVYRALDSGGRDNVTCIVISRPAAPIEQ